MAAKCRPAAAEYLQAASVAHFTGASITATGLVSTAGVDALGWSRYRYPEPLQQQQSGFLKAFWFTLPLLFSTTQKVAQEAR